MKEKYAEMAKAMKLFDDLADDLRHFAKKCSDAETAASYKGLANDVMEGLALIKTAILFSEAQTIQTDTKSFTVADLLKNTGITPNRK